MAETKKTTNTTKKTTAPKSTKADNALEDALKLIKEMQKANEKLKEELANTKQTVVVNNTDNIVGKKIKCINLLHNPLNVSTEQDGKGRLFTFEKYGDTRLIRFDDLSDIVASYPNTMESGACYICNKDAVELLGLTEEYELLYDKKTIDKLIYLKNESDVDLFIGMNKVLQDSTAREIARLVNEGETFDLNYLAKIKEETNLDILEIAKSIREETTIKE